MQWILWKNCFISSICKCFPSILEQYCFFSSKIVLPFSLYSYCRYGIIYLYMSNVSVAQDRHLNPLRFTFKVCFFFLPIEYTCTHDLPVHTGGWVVLDPSGPRSGLRRRTSSSAVIGLYLPRPVPSGSANGPTTPLKYHKTQRINRYINGWLFLKSLNSSFILKRWAN